MLHSLLNLAQFITLPEAEKFLTPNVRTYWLEKSKEKTLGLHEVTSPVLKASLQENMPFKILTLEFP